MRKLRTLVPLIGLAAVGCGRVATQTTVRDDLSLQRKVLLQVSGEFNFGSEGKESKLEDMFVLPAQPPYTLKREKLKDSGEKGLLERELTPGNGFENDIVLKGKQGGLTSNTGGIRTLPDGKVEYVETLRWTGKENTFGRTPAELRAAVKAALPPTVAQTETIDRATSAIKRTIWAIFFGPGDPLLPTLLLHPDLGARRLRSRIHKEADPFLVAELGTTVEPAARAEFIKNFVVALDVDELMASKDKSPAEATGSDDKGSLVSMLFVVKVSGKIVETNGEVDPVSSEVSWALFGEAAQAGDVQMRLVYEPAR